MGWLALTRKVGQSIQITDPEGKTHLLTLAGRFGDWIRIEITSEGVYEVYSIPFYQRFPMKFGVISWMEGRDKFKNRAKLLFDFPIEYKILRSELVELCPHGNSYRCEQCADEHSQEISDRYSEYYASVL